MANASPASTLAARTDMLRRAYRGRKPGFLHDTDSDQARREVWSAVARAPRGVELSVGRDATIQGVLAMIPGIVLAGTHLRGASDARILRHWQSTGQRPRAYGLYRIAGVLQIIGTLITGVATLGVGIGAAYWILKKQTEKLDFQGPASAAKRKRKRRRRSR